MRVKKDGSAAVLYCIDADNKDHAENIFHALRFAFLIAAQKQALFVLHSVSIFIREKPGSFPAAPAPANPHTRTSGRTGIILRF